MATDNKRTKSKKKKPKKIDLIKFYKDNDLDFNAFSEEVFITAISLGLMINESNPDLNLAEGTTFKFSYPDEKGECELYVRRVPAKEKSKIIAPPEKKIIIN